MSYCRFSSDNGYSDVYVYPSTGGGYVTHVAGRRPPPGAPPDGMAFLGGSLGTPPDLAEYERLAAARRAWDAENPYVPIDHPEAGAGFVHDAPGECADNLERLRAEGFHVPQGAIDALRAEQKEICE